MADTNLNCGGVAQLGARLNGIQKVSGSIPLISTSKYKGLHFSVIPFLGVPSMGAY
jgi:hypothetical protein